MAATFAATLFANPPIAEAAGSFNEVIEVAGCADLNAEPVVNPDAPGGFHCACRPGYYDIDGSYGAACRYGWGGLGGRSFVDPVCAIVPDFCRPQPPPTGPEPDPPNFWNCTRCVVDHALCVGNAHVDRNECYGDASLEYFDCLANAACYGDLRRAERTCDDDLWVASEGCDSRMAACVDHARFEGRGWGIPPEVAAPLEPEPAPVFAAPVSVGTFTPTPAPAPPPSPWGSFYSFHW